MKKRAYHIYATAMTGFAWLLLVHTGCSLAETPSRVVIVPFAIHATEEFTFLKESLSDMLTSRLVWEEKVIIVDKDKTKQVLKGISDNIDEKGARSIGEKLGAQYVLFGNMTILGDRFSLKAMLVDIHNRKPPVTVNHKRREMDMVIPTINEFVTEINQKIFGRGVPDPQESSPLQTPAASDIYTHPERLMEESKGKR